MEDWELEQKKIRTLQYREELDDQRRKRQALENAEKQFEKQKDWESIMEGQFSQDIYDNAKRK